jgi:hypothetical protein
MEEYGHHHGHPLPPFNCLALSFISALVAARAEAMALLLGRVEFVSTQGPMSLASSAQEFRHQKQQLVYVS